MDMLFMFSILLMGVIFSCAINYLKAVQTVVALPNLLGLS